MPWTLILDYCYCTLLGLWIHLTFSLTRSIPSSFLSYHLISFAG